MFPIILEEEITIDFNFSVSFINTINYYLSEIAMSIWFYEVEFW